MTVRRQTIYLSTLFLSLSLSLLPAGISPTVFEVNIGPVPLDVYNSTQTNSALGMLIPNCPSSYTIKNCYKLLFNNNPLTTPYTGYNYVGQGVTGVRFQFSTAATGWHSTPWDSSGNVSAAWVTNLTAFLTDLKGYGIARVTPTPAIDGWGSTAIIPSSPVKDCYGSTNLMFYKAMPYGHLQTNGYPDCQGANNAYSTANSNPYFWGWNPLFNLASGIFGAVHSSGIAMAEFDINNEINLSQFTVQARLFYDNKHSANGSAGTTDVLAQLRVLASANSLNPNVITASVSGTDPSLSGYHCASVYGDSALILGASELLGTLAGNWSAFGVPFLPTVTNGLVCGGTTTGMIQLPVRYTTLPVVTDIHLAPCVVNAAGSCTSTDATSTATTFYSDVWTFLTTRGMTSNVAMIGETSNNQYCDAETPAMASQNVAGYNASSLRTNHASGTTLRPWENNVNSCYGFPLIINPPYTP